jgi:hypothetical protein
MHLHELIEGEGNTISLMDLQNLRDAIIEDKKPESVIFT